MHDLIRTNDRRVASSSRRTTVPSERARSGADFLARSAPSFIRSTCELSPSPHPGSAAAAARSERVKTDDINDVSASSCPVLPRNVPLSAESRRRFCWFRVTTPNHKLLGVTVQSNLKIDSHVQYLLAQRLYLLKLLRHQGMPIDQLATVTCMCYYCLAYLICSSVLGRLPFC